MGVISCGDENPPCVESLESMRHAWKVGARNARVFASNARASSASWTSTALRRFCGQPDSAGHLSAQSLDRDPARALLEHTLRELADFRALMRSKDEDLRSKDEDLRTLMRSKDEDLRSKDEDLQQLNAELRRTLPQVVQLRPERMKLFETKNIVDCRGALEYVAGLLDMKHAGHEAGWATYFSTPSNCVLQVCNSTTKILADNRHRQHSAESLAKKVKGIWNRLSSDLHTTHKFSVEGASIVLRSNGLSTSDILLLQQLFVLHGIKCEIRNKD